MKSVAAMLITRGRQRWAAQALACFQAQTYEPKFLLIVDDLDDASFPSKPDYPNVWYGLIEKPLTIPEKRNIAADVAVADLICVFDSDDWSAPTRLEDQVRLLEESGKQVAAFHSMLFYHEEWNRAFKYVGDHLSGVGTSLLFTKSFWEDHPFRCDPKTPNVGEDNAMCKAARERGQIITTDAQQLMVARIHQGNTSVKKTGAEGMEYRSVSLDALPSGFPR